LFLFIVRNCISKLHLNAASSWVYKQSIWLENVSHYSGLVLILSHQDKNVKLADGKLADGLWRDHSLRTMGSQFTLRKSRRDPLGHSSFHGNV
jgi:hypothetical protein